ncbi:MAG: hypothetical protein K8H88_19900 [Sandaracinaceae bacterium]|nr:hypothetical protein [Sandaracinaceae bacterium]
MGILYSQKVFEGPISGTTAVYTPAELNGSLAQADKFFVSVRAAQSSGTSPTVTVTLEHSNDNVNFTSKATLINASALSTTAITNAFGSDLGTSNVGGAFMRLAIQLGGTTPASNLQVTLCGRSQ